MGAVSYVGGLTCVGALGMRTGIVFAATGQKQPDRNRNQEGRFHIGNLAQTAKNPKVNYSFETVQYQHPHSMKNALRDSPPNSSGATLLRRRVGGWSCGRGCRRCTGSRGCGCRCRRRVGGQSFGCGCRWHVGGRHCRRRARFCLFFANPSTVPHKPIQIPLLIITVSSYSVKLF